MDTSEFIQKTFSLCQHQREVINPYTSETVLVPCGVCPACRFNKSVVAQNRVHAQTLSSKYCYFITLTYATRFIPRYVYKVSELDEDRVTVYCNPVDRNPLYRTYVYCGKKHRHLVKGLSKPIEPFDFTCRREYFSAFINKADLSLNNKYPSYRGQIAYLDHADLSLFMKRLRKRISQLGEYEKIHTYIVGEYGPRTFRPHFHLLLFFDADRTAENIIRIARSCWRFGRVDISQSRGYSEDYVSSYLNSFTSLPLHLQEIRSIRPFSRFSNKFGYAFFRNEIEQAKKGDFSAFVNGKSLPYNGRNTIVFPWRSIIDTCFFRPALRRGSTVYELTEILRHVRNLCRRPAFLDLTPFQIPKVLYKYIGEHLAPSDAVKFVQNDLPLHRIFSFLKIDWERVISGFEDDVVSFHSRLYGLLRQSQLFLSSLGYNLRSTRVNCMVIFNAVQNSINFYDYRERESLRRLFEASQAFESDWSDIFWNRKEERIKEFRESELGSLCSSRLSREVYNRVKHREINDANEIFTNKSFYGSKV